MGSFASTVSERTSFFYLQKVDEYFNAVLSLQGGNPIKEIPKTIKLSLNYLTF